MKKQSAASSKPPEPRAFFVDRSLGSITVARSLRDAGLDVEVHDEHFPQDTPDETWLHVAGARRWVVLTRDKRIRYRPSEIEALLEHGVQAFVLAAGNLTGEESAACFLRAMPRIQELLASKPNSFVASISSTGAVKVLRERA